MYLRTLAFFSSLSLMVSCITVPPIAVYNRSYVGPKLRMKQNDSKQYSLSIDTSTFSNSDDPVSKNNARYVLGSFVSNLKKAKSKTSEKIKSRPYVTSIDKFTSITLKNGKNDLVDYNASITIDTYDDVYSFPSDGQTKLMRKETTKCFYVSIEISNIKNPDDSYIFRSNGCPGISDPRLVASRIIEIMFERLWLIDSARTEIIAMNGASPDSWLSAFETDPEVDKILGYQ